MDELVPRLALSLAIGLLVGLERGWRERAAPAGSRTAGIRTYGISGFLGGICAALADAMDAPAVLVAGFLGFALVFAWFKVREAENDRDFSVTGMIAGLCVFALGALAVVGDYRAAAAGSAALAGVLASREVLHGLLLRLTWTELRSALVLAIMTAVVLPVLPNRTIDPWGGFNPWEIWLFTVLTAAISFLGYIAVRILGPTRGLLVSALAGALVSSTAVTVAFARTAKAGENVRRLSGAASIAAMVSVLRVAVLVAIIRPSVLEKVGPSALAAALVFGGVGALLLARGSSENEPQAASRNPFELGTLLAFATLFAVVSTASAALVGRFGDGSLIVSSGLSGTFDVDVAVLSALRMTGTQVPLVAVGDAVLAALGANALGRLAMATVAGPPAYWIPLLVATVLAAAAGYAAFMLIVA